MLDKVLQKFTKIYRESSNETRKRTVSGFILWLAVFMLTVKGNVWYFALVLIVGLLMMYEIMSMLSNIKASNINYYYTYRKWSVIYIIICCVALILIRESLQGVKITFWLFSVVWSSDVAAFLFGKKYGRLKLAPTISPKKTFEGAICGIIVGSFVSLMCYYFFGTHSKNSFASDNFILLTIIIIIMSQIGDLLESWLKRECDIKDSGNMIPGHGGVCDRFDGISLVAPFVYIILFLNSGILF